MKIIRITAFVTLLFFLTGCQETLYSGLSEDEANMMVAVLAQNGIKASKLKQTDKEYSIQLDEENFANAVQVLKAKGYPKTKLQSFSEIFPDQGLVKTPFEQKIRHAYAMSQDLSQSLSLWHGVVSARVHIMIPEREKFGETTQKTTASVVIQHNSDVSLESQTPKFKQFIANSVNGLAYENVTIVFSPVERFKGQTVDGQDIQKVNKDNNAAKDGQQSINQTTEPIVSTQPASKAAFFSSSNLKVLIGWLFLGLGIFTTIGVLFFRHHKVKQ